MRSYAAFVTAAVIRAFFRELFQAVGIRARILIQEYLNNFVKAKVRNI